ncbi:beta-ketoacyl synthase N-terminal-like domain-containing protein, partial [Pseudomonas sp. EL_65y_Pfl2_R96]|uniref:beta-ketoacyl synthase N-terminal-like domain-containing protein n=1 Tax=Pseudomonas sp. EL_65y_Pfl2_R96 TaxID=3088699 RepID=UPI0030DBFD0D
MDPIFSFAQKKFLHLITLSQRDNKLPLIFLDTGILFNTLINLYTICDIWKFPQMKDHDTSNPVSLTHILSHWASTKPDATAYVFLADGEHETHSISYSELFHRSAGLAKKLQTIGRFGDRMLMFYPTGIEFIVAFYGCLHAGLIPVPAYAPKKNSKQDRIDKIIVDCSPAAILGTTDIIHRLSDSDHPLALNGLPPLLATDSEQYTTTDLSISDKITGNTLACLQYTSGSTGSPKGVMLTHENFIKNQQFTQKNWQHDHTSDWMCWLPLFHDMGLGNIVQTLYLGSRCILIPPETFVQKPIRWLNAISRYAAHTSGGPDFAYALCADIPTEEIPADLDLSNWKVAYNGAEPINPNSLLKFTEKFSRFGFCAQAFSPCYGLAEATLAVTAVHKGQPVESISIDVAAFAENRVIVVPDAAGGRVLVSSGISPSDDSVRIVDPNTYESLPEDAIGEIWCCSGGVGQGYWNNSEATRTTFQATLASTSTPHYMRTGDLGFFHAGQLYVTGRLKDVIIIRGKNYYPQDIEFSCSGCHPALVHGGTTAFVDGEQSIDRVIIFQEVKRTQVRGADFEHMLALIKKSVATEHGLALQAIYLLKPGQLPRTSSGKVRRAECLKKLRANEVLSIAQWQSGPATPPLAETIYEVPESKCTTRRSQAEIDQWLAETLTTKFSISQDAIKSDANFAELGLDSINITVLAQLMTEFAGRSVSATQFFDYPTLGELCAHLADAVRSQSRKSPAQSPTLDQHQYAIVGMACDFPGATSLEGFWQMIAAGQQGFAPLATRWSEVGGSKGGENARAGVIDDLFMFDARFFRISDEEARSMDPQQRLLLSTAWEALEHASLSPTELAGSDTGVFIGISSNDYSRGLLDHSDTPYFLTGSALSLAANRISYVFDFKGPSLAIDTACSSSLVALHNALNSLASHECDLALVGGVNALLSSPVDASFNKAGMTSKSSSARIFDAAADGYVRGEGCGVLIIKRLSDAQDNNDRILAVIASSAINQDGRSNGLTAPNGVAQQKVIHKALH